MFLMTPAIARKTGGAGRLSGYRTCSRLRPVDAVGLWAIAARSPDAPAVIDATGPDGAVVSYADLAREADRYGRGFQSLGLTAGDTVAALLPNGVTALAVYSAATAPRACSWPTSGSPGPPRRRPAWPGSSTSTWPAGRAGRTGCRASSRSARWAT